MTGIRPLGDRVVIKKAEMEEKTQGGLILTSAAKEKPQMAEVVAVGPGTKDEPMELKVGDKVVFSKYGGAEIKYQGEEYTIMHRVKFWQSLNKTDERGYKKWQKIFFTEKTQDANYRQAWIN